MSETSPRKARAFWPVLIGVYALDFISKQIAVAELSPMYTPHRIIGDLVRFTLTYNKGAAMGLSLGGYSRVGFTVTAAIILVALGVIYRRTEHTAVGAGVALAMIAAGALGNLTDRIGVVPGSRGFRRRRNWEHAILHIQCRGRGNHVWRDSPRNSLDERR